MNGFENSNDTDIITIHHEYQTIKPPFGQATYLIIEIILLIPVVGSISCFGVISNFINIIVYYRQGIMTHSCNVSLFGLALSDFFYCFFTLWGSLCALIYRFFDTSNFRVGMDDLNAYTAKTPSTIFMDISGALTAFIASERLVSVAFPFKVKSLFTPKRSRIAICAIFIGINILSIPFTFEYLPYLITDQHPRRNVTILVFYKMPIQRDHLKLLLGIYSYTCPVFLRAAAVFTVIFCNCIIFWKVNLSQKFRKSTAATTTTQSVSASTDQDHPISLKQEQNKQDNSNTGSTTTNQNNSKEMKLLRMITAVCILYSTCYMIEFLYGLVFYLSGLKRHIHYHRLTRYVAYFVVKIVITINSSANFFIYYNMSTRYREELRMCLCCKKGK